MRSQKARAITEGASGWIFDPSTIPADRVVTVTVYFLGNCTQE
jgi:hypothetical protein